MLQWLEEQPNSQAKDLFLRLQAECPDTFADGQLRTLQRRVKQWRSGIARRLVMGSEEAGLPVIPMLAPKVLDYLSAVEAPLPLCQ